MRKFHAHCLDDTARASATMKQPQTILSIAMAQAPERTLCEFNVQRLSDLRHDLREHCSSRAEGFSFSQTSWEQHIGKFNRPKLTNTGRGFAR
jgi:hypothetical protein